MNKQAASNMKYEEVELAKVCKELMHFESDLLDLFSKKSVPAVLTSKLIRKTSKKLVNYWNKKKKIMKQCCVQFEGVLVKKKRKNYNSSEFS